MAKQEQQEEEEEEELVVVNELKRKPQKNKPDADLSFLGSAVPTGEAVQKWPARYGKVLLKENGSNGVVNRQSGVIEDIQVLQAKCHYTQVQVDGCACSLGDCAYVKAVEGELHYIARIVELFESTDGEPYFTAQWFYRAKDTVIKGNEDLIDNKRVFLSDIKDDNPLDCTVSKIRIAKVAPNIDLEAKNKKIPPCELYYDMKYSLPYLTFTNIMNETNGGDNDTTSTVSSESESNGESSSGPEMRMLDLYSGCGAMSTGLAIGATLSGIKLVSKWAVDINPHACKSLKMNHPRTEVRNEAAEDFLSLLKEWPNLCQKYAFGKKLNESSDVEIKEEEVEAEQEEGEEDKEEGREQNDKEL